MLGMSRISLLVIVSALLVSISVLDLYYVHQLPTERIETETLFYFRQEGEYDCLADLKPSLMYDNKSVLGPDEGTLYRRLVEALRITFSYTLSCSSPANGTIKYRITERLETSKWNKTVFSAPWETISFDGARKAFETSHFINLTAYEIIVDAIEKETGTAVAEYTLFIGHDIHLEGNTETSHVEEDFNPNLRMHIRPSTPEGDIIAIESENPSNSRAITRAETIRLDWVYNQRYYSYVLAIGILPVLSYTVWQLAKSHTPRPKKPEEVLKEIIKPYKEIIAEAAEPSCTVKDAPLTIVPMKSLEDLARVSESLLKPILHSQKGGTHTFCLLDDTVRYEFETEIGEPEQGKRMTPRDDEHT